jgi:apolipoprotein D and lipocalin family protein
MNAKGRGLGIMRILKVLLILAVSGCVSTGNLPAQKVVKQIDIKRYMGDWFVIAAIPTSFDSPYNPVEHYTWNEKENRVDVDYHYNEDSLTGPLKHMNQNAFIDSESNAEWKIQPFWPLRFSYLIVDLADDYSDVVIGVPSRKYAWIMARTTHMPEARFLAQKAKLQALGYDTSKLVRAIHSDSH